MAVAKEIDKLQRDIEVYCSEIYKSNPEEPGYHRLPKCWNNKDRSRSLKLSHFCLTVSYVGGFTDRHAPNVSQDPGTVRADVPIPLTTGIYYFEITISSKGSNGWSLSIGVQQKTSSLTKHVGLEHTSYGFHSDGSLYHWSGGSGVKFGPRSVETDTLGCGVDFLSRSLFFTRNGVFLGKAFEGKIPANSGTRLYPAVGLHGRGVRITTNFGQRPFSYAFDLHIKRERLAHENQLITRICKEEFAGPKMKELVSGYLVHHGYVATAQCFSRWADLPLTNINSPSTVSGNQSTLHSPLHSASDPCLGSTHTIPDSHPVTSDNLNTDRNRSLPRRHSDGFFTKTNFSSPSQLPGFASMIHRRRLRALCRRYQYGRAAATLHRLYPQVLERCPELLIQLRCRQLIEMMRRHALRRGRGQSPDGSPHSDSTNSAVAPAKIQRLSDSDGNPSSCCVTEKNSKGAQSQVLLQRNGSFPGAMDIDSEASHMSSLTTESLNPDDLDDDDDDGENGDDVDDDDDFGMEEDTGVSVFNTISDQPSVSTHRMEVDAEPQIGTANKEGQSVAEDKDEVPCLLRHVQFGRSLVNLVKEVRAKTGGLSFETEKLLQQSVSLLAYSSPVSSICPLRGLFDPAWRDTVANVINSAVLKAHDLPVQPTLEQGLLSLQTCLKDPQFAEGQILGHFLLYHLSPTQLAKMELDRASQNRTLSNRRSGSRLKKNDFHKSPPSVSTINGHVSGSRRRRRDGESSAQDADDTDDYGSSVDDVFTKDDEDDAEEKDDASGCVESCRPDDESSNDDDDDDPGNDPAIDHRPQTRSSHPSGTRRSSATSSDRDPISGDFVGGRSQASSFRTLHLSNRQSFVHLPTPGFTRPTVIARCLPALILEPTRTHLITSIPPTTRRLVNRTIAVESPLIPVSSVSNVRQSSDSEVPPNQYLDSSFNGLLSLTYPQHAEFLSAMNDALKAYAGSLLITDSEFPGPSTLHPRRPHGDDPPPDAGANGSGMV